MVDREAIERTKLEAYDKVDRAETAVKDKVTSMIPGHSDALVDEPAMKASSELLDLRKAKLTEINKKLFNYTKTCNLYIESGRQLGEMISSYAASLTDASDQLAVQAASGALKVHDLHRRFLDLQNDMFRSITQKVEEPMANVIHTEIKQARQCVKAYEKSRDKCVSVSKRGKQDEIATALQDRDSTQKAAQSSLALAHTCVKVETVKMFTNYYSIYMDFNKKLNELLTPMTDDYKKFCKNIGADLPEGEFEEVVNLTDVEKLNQVLTKLLEGENKYLFYLKKFTEFKEVLVNKGTLSPEALATLISNLDQLFPFHQKFVAQIDAATKSEDPAAAIGSLFLEHAAQLKKSYCEYTQNSHLAFEAFTGLTRSYHTLSLIKSVERSDPLNTADLATVIASPTKQLQFYLPLLEALLELIPTKLPGYDALAEAIEILTELISAVELSKRQSENMSNVLEVSKTLKNIEFTLVEAHRVFIFDGDVIVVPTTTRPKEGATLTANHRLFLFNDMLLLSLKPSGRFPFMGASSEQYKYEMTIPVKTLKVVHVSEIDAGYRNAFSLTWTDNGEPASLLLATNTSGQLEYWVDQINKVTTTMFQQQVFGKELELLMECPEEKGRDIPLFVEDAITYIKTHKGLSTEGIFRLSGNQFEMTRLQSLIDSGIKPPYEYKTVHNAAGLLKQWIRSLPDPVLTYSFYDRWLTFASSPKDPADVDRLTSKMRDLVSKLPKYHRFVLRTLVELFVDVYDHSHINMMHAQNLSVVFTPSMLRSSSPEGLISGKTFGVIENLIIYYHDIFPDIIKEQATIRDAYNAVYSPEVVAQKKKEKRDAEKEVRIAAEAARAASHDESSTTPKLTAQQWLIDQRRLQEEEARLAEEEEAAEARKIIERLEREKKERLAAIELAEARIREEQLAREEKLRQLQQEERIADEARKLRRESMRKEEEERLQAEIEAERAQKEARAAAKLKAEREAAEAREKEEAERVASLPVCAGCGERIDGDDGISALNKPWHDKCFVCAVCKKPFEGSYIVKEGKAICKPCSQKASGSAAVCGRCSQPLSGKVVKAFSKSWHQACWTCSSCNAPLTGGFFDSGQGTPLCRPCAEAQAE
ncbi:lim domain protein [Pelomyxa schiedti]|nr:lim domain protein [Pelomyxa schiedti]